MSNTLSVEEILEQRPFSEGLSAVRYYKAEASARRFKSYCERNYIQTTDDTYSADLERFRLEDSGWGYRDRQGCLVSPTQYLSAGQFKKGAAVVRLHKGGYAGNCYSVIDQYGEMVGRDHLGSYGIFKSIKQLYNGFFWTVRCYSPPGKDRIHSLTSLRTSDMKPISLPVQSEAVSDFYASNYIKVGDSTSTAIVYTDSTVVLKLAASFDRVKVTDSAVYEKLPAGGVRRYASPDWQPNETELSELPRYYDLDTPIHRVERD